MKKNRITLNSGVDMPLVGSGTNTFGKKEQDYYGEVTNDISPMVTAIHNGYRHFDSALIYGNETIVGRGISESSVERENFFIASKLPGEPPYIDSIHAVKESIKTTLTNLETDYIDLYYLHYPWEKMEEVYSVWKILENYYIDGIFKSVGVSNFNQSQLSYLLEYADVRPAAIQIPSTLGNWNERLIDFSLSNYITPVVWSPLASISEAHKERLQNIGMNYDRTWAQILLNYHISNGSAVIPKSHNQKRQKENLNIFDFELSNKEKYLIRNM